MTDDIVDRLRARYKVRCRRCDHFNSDMAAPHAVMDAAADEIDRLRAERDALANALRHMDDLVQSQGDELARLAVELESERALADRLADDLATELAAIDFGLTTDALTKWRQRRGTH